MALVNKNQMAGQRGGEARNKALNGGIDGCLPKYNAANGGAHWRVKNRKGRKQLNWGIKSKKH